MIKFNSTVKQAILQVKSVLL